MLAEKVSAADLASLMPQSTGSDDAASIMPKLIMIQNRLNQLEGQCLHAHTPVQFFFPISTDCIYVWAF